jgi:regulation of enolase protein 1 (concanavalin A-like superfamily)
MDKAGSGTAARTWLDTWRDGKWLNPPPGVRENGSELLVTAEQGSDFWRTTSYDFVHDSGHAWLLPLPEATAVEVRFVLDYQAQFDQAGVLVRGDEETWTKAGVEISDGVPQLGAVVTRQVSDWSVAPVPEWGRRDVTVRASRAGNALTVRARVADEPWRLVRVAPLTPGQPLAAGPYCCAPTRPGLEVTFRGAVLTAADSSLHPDDQST